MKIFITLSLALLLTGCAQVVASNQKSITINAPPVAAAQAFQMADNHCKQFKKVAVPSGTVYGTSIVFNCEKP